MTADDEPTTSRMGRIARSTSLGTRVAGSLVGGKIAAAFKRGEAKDEAIARTHRKNAERVVETLGQLKGAAMKIGQSIAVMGGELPPEAAAVYRKLFDAAPPVEFDTIRPERPRCSRYLVGIKSSLTISTPPCGCMWNIRDTRGHAKCKDLPTTHSAVTATMWALESNISCCDRRRTS